MESRPQNNDVEEISVHSMAIPRGKAVALPSIQISEDEDKDVDRGQYGGKGDKPHLGGFTDFDVSEENDTNHTTH